MRIYAPKAVTTRGRNMRAASLTETLKFYRLSYTQGKTVGL
jgi:hypothetical protein